MFPSKRLDWIDIARGIGIIFVVFAHTLIPQMRENSEKINFLWIFIYNFHMPLFFFVSGLLFEKNLSRYCNKPKFILGKAKYLMLPYLIFSVFAYVFIAAAMHVSPLASVLSGGGYAATPFREAVPQVLFYNGHTDQHLWFVYSLFIVFCLNILFPRLGKSRLFLIVLLALYISKAYIHYFGILNYTASDLLFFSLARVIYSRGKQFRMNRVLFAAAAVTFIVLSSVYSYFYITKMPSGILKGILYLVRSLASAAGIITVCHIAKIAEHTSLSGILKTAGSYSYDIYLMHAPFLVSGSMGLLTRFTSIPPIICSFIVLIIGLAVPYIISRYVIRRIPILSVPLLGKRY